MKQAKNAAQMAIVYKRQNF